MSGRPEKVGYVSPSQIATFRDCPRKWGYKYIEGLEAPPNRYAELGTKIHKIFEDWFVEGKRLDLNTKEGQIVKVGLKHYPAPSSELRVEHEMLFQFDGIDYYGKIDLHYALNESTLAIDDHKSTTKFDWVEPEDRLHLHPQVVLYSAWGTIAYTFPYVRTRLVYHRTTPPPASTVSSIKWSRDQIWDAMGPVHADAKQIVRSRKLKVLELEQHLETCHKYGGCPFQDRCIGKMSAVDRMKSSFRQAEREIEARKLKHAPDNRGSKMGLLDTLRAKSGQAASAAQAAPAQRRAALAAQQTQAAPSRAPLARRATSAAQAAQAAPASRAPLARRAPAAGPASQTASNAGYTEESLIPAVSENYDPPEESDVPETQEGAPARRARGPNKPKAAGLSPDLTRALFHIAAITAGHGPDVAEEHFQAWFTAG